MCGVKLTSIGWVVRLAVRCAVIFRYMSGSGKQSEVSAVVLAAGMSRRMGTPKQLLRLAGQTILEHTLKNVRASAVSEIVLVLGFAAESGEFLNAAPPAGLIDEWDDQTHAVPVGRFENLIENDHRFFV